VPTLDPLSLFSPAPLVIYTTAESHSVRRLVRNNDN
jgi:hypothetical protein